MRGTLIALLAASAIGSTCQAGEILRCDGVNGEVMYTNLGCPANTQSHHVSSYEAVPDAPPPTHEYAAEAAAISARLAEEAAQRAEAAAYHASSNYYEASAEAESGGPYHQYEDNNLYYPAYFGGYPLLGAGFRNNNHHVDHHTAFARSDHNDHLRGVHPQPVRPPVKFVGRSR